MPSGYCMKERKQVEIKGPEEVTTKNGRRAVRGVCPDCGTKIFRMLGKDESLVGDGAGKKTPASTATAGAGGAAKQTPGGAETPAISGSAPPAWQPDSGSGGSSMAAAVAAFVVGFLLGALIGRRD